MSDMDILETIQQKGHEYDEGAGESLLRGKDETEK